MKFEDGDLVLVKKQIYGENCYVEGMVVRTDGGYGKDRHGDIIAGSDNKPYFVWFGQNNFDWFSEIHLIKIYSIKRSSFEKLSRMFEENIVNNKELIFDNLRTVILLNRYNELKREFETNQVQAL